MPFNSSQNSFNSSYSPQESFQVLRNSYAIPPMDGVTMLQNAALHQRPPNNNEYVQPMNVHSAYSYYNQDELKYINSYQNKHSANNYDMETLVGEGIKREIQKQRRIALKNNYDDSDDEMEGMGIFKKIRKAAKKSTKAIKKTANKSTKAIKKTAIKSGDAIKESTINKDGLIHKAIEKTNDKVIPMAGQALGSALGAAIGSALGNPALGAQIGGKLGEKSADIGRDALEKKTGYGKVPGVGKYKKNINLDKVIDKYVPDLKTGGSDVKMKSAVVTRPKPRQISKRMTERNDVVKKIMKEKGLSLPQASKHVKENNLWK